MTTGATVPAARVARRENHAGLPYVLMALAMQRNAVCGGRIFRTALGQDVLGRLAWMRLILSTACNTSMAMSQRKPWPAEVVFSSSPIIANVKIDVSARTAPPVAHLIPPRPGRQQVDRHVDDQPGRLAVSVPFALDFEQPSAALGPA
jgi:hypothetical protein